MNLKLFAHLQGQNTASLVLMPSSPGNLSYFLISNNINNSIVVSGTCKGTLKTEGLKSFDVVLSSVTPLLDKNLKFEITCDDDIVMFKEVTGKFTVRPLCVEHISEESPELIAKFQGTMNKIRSYIDSKERIGSLQRGMQELESELENLEEVSHAVHELDLEHNPEYESPGGVSHSTVAASSIKRTERQLEKVKEELSKLDSESAGVDIVDMGALRRMSSIASRYNTTVSMCDDFAIVNLSSCFILQKGEFTSRAIQGKLLHRLLAERDGRFFSVDGDLVFVSDNHATKGLSKGNKAISDDDTMTFIFIHPYLPSLSVNTSIITKGSTKEKYSIDIGGIAPYITTICNKFDCMVFDMGSGKLKLSNDRGEELVHPFNIKEVKNKELSSAIKSGKIANIEMAEISIPKELQRVFSDFGNEITFYVKERKIILQSEQLWAVFGR